MSYILDALKKAERERDLQQVPNIMTVHEHIAANPNRHWTIIGFSVVFIGIALWLVLFSLRTKSSPPSLELNKASNQNLAALAAKQTAAAVPASSSPPLSQLPAAPKSDTAAIKTAESKNPTQPETAGITRSIPGEKAAESARHAGQTVRTEPAARPDIEEEEVPAIPLAEMVRIQKQLRSDVPGAAATGGNPDSKTGQSQPASLQEALGKMKVSLLYYSENKAERTIFINGKKYREGDFVEGLYLLESITLEGAILSYQGERVTLRPISR